ncbi:MAG: DUF2752 domain-containing protein [Lentisphaeria bacterium]|nr:DUF2752 domain-containing protein [Lentisphaeria bacterium]
MSENVLKPACPWKIWGIAGVLFTLGCGAFILYRFYPAWQNFFPPCPFHEAFHLYCPGCGSTRATYCLLHGDLAGVCRYNPFYLPTLVFAALLIFLHKWAGKPVIVRSYIVLLVLFWICRNLPWYPFTLLAPPPGF